MTEDEALEELCERAKNKNLWFGQAQPSGTPMIKTDSGPNLEEYRRLFGGAIDYQPYNPSELAWFIDGGEAIKLATKLLTCKSFWKSGKYNYAAEMVERENNPDPHSWPSSVKRH